MTVTVTVTHGMTMIVAVAVITAVFKITTSSWQVVKMEASKSVEHGDLGSFACLRRSDRDRVTVDLFPEFKD